MNINLHVRYKQAKQYVHKKEGEEENSNLSRDTFES
jgi:hypothetical protein